ncbi:hypothetical protein Rhopal_004759-T1 [Rhodotorula paludigena]|uniref:PH domain-containing protein n=1 Tax=Rhodotorula paludigena TaxID=86838 RepID=A0AAV5GQD4_9BASI|nr:hypothetical protein Rhopal_004759-T1 [Rhodotorula paludigena]
MAAAPSHDAPSSSSANPLKSRPRPPPLAPVSVPALAQTQAHSDFPPQSPAVVLSPSTPDFPALALAPEPTELVPAQLLSHAAPSRFADEHEAAVSPVESDEQQEVLVRSSTPASSDEGGAGSGSDEGRTRVNDPTVRHSLMLLDSRLAEIESLGFGSAAGVGRAEGEAHKAATPSGLVADASLNSLASLATSTTSSEDAFDIADFPSIDPQLDSSYELDPSTLPQQRKRSSDLMSFPVPPSLPSIPISRQFASPALDEHEEHMFEQLAQLGQRNSVQGLGLFSVDAPQPSPVLSSSIGRSSRSSTLSNSSTLSSKSFDASTLASSAANTSAGPRDKDEPVASADVFPPELSSTVNWFAISPPPTTPRLPPPIDPLLANSGAGSAHPALASPFADSSSLSRRPSPTAAQYSARSSSLPQSRAPSRTGTTAEADPAASHDSEPAPLPTMSPVVNGPFVASPEFGELEILADDAAPAPASQGQAQIPASPSMRFGQTIRRLSSFGLLKKRKSDAVLRESTSSNTSVSAVAEKTERPSLSKRKSEIALSSFLRSSRSTADKENSPVPTSPKAVSSRPLISPQQPPVGPNKLTRRSASSPKLSKLFGSSNEPRPPLPVSPSSYAGFSPASTSTSPASPPTEFSARPRTLSFGEGGAAVGAAEQQGSLRIKKRFSMYFNQLGTGKAGDEEIPPVPPTPKEHLEAKMRAPAGIVIDVAKANQLIDKTSAVPTSADTLDIASPRSAQMSPVFSEGAAPGTSSPATSAFQQSYARTFSASKPLSAPLPTASLSAPAHQSGFAFASGPPSPGLSSAHSSAHEHVDSRLSLSGFLRTTDLAEVRAETSGAVEPIKHSTRSSSVFPTAKLAQERIEAKQRATESRSSHRSAVDAGAGTGSRPVSPYSDTWSRSASPALRDTLAQQQQAGVFAPQNIVAFPVRMQVPTGLPAVPAVSASPESIHDGLFDDDSAEDDYGSGTDKSDSGDEDDDDRPIGVANPGALTAQKSLRLTAAKKSRSERKTRETKDKALREQQAQRSARARREDPFELEHAAAMVATPPVSNDGHSTAPSAYSAAIPRHVARPQLSPIASASSIASLQSMGHDSLLPQSDASIDRRSNSAGMKRSPSAPLDPMVADSSLTIDTPEVPQEPLPRARAPFRLPSRRDSNSRERSRSRSRKPDAAQPAAPAAEAPLRSPTFAPAPPKPTFRPPPVPSASSPSVPTFDRRPSLPHKSSESPTASPGGTPNLGRRPSLHPDHRPGTISRQASGASSRSGGSGGLSRTPTTSVGSRSRSTTVSTTPSPGIEQRIYVDSSFSQFLKVNMTDKLLVGEVVAFAKAKGALSKETPGAQNEGGWALWESWRSLGIERPIREYEFLADVVKSWDHDENALFFRRTTMWPIISAHARLPPAVSKTGPVQIELKKSKWSKRFLELKDGVVSQSKSEKGKDSTTLCQLSNFDVFLVSADAAHRLKAPRPFVFALKSRLTRAHFEETAEWCHYLSTKTPEEAASWVKTITEAGNSFARQREQIVLGASSAPSATSSPIPASPLLAGAAAAASTAPPVPVKPNPVRNVLSRPAPPVLAQRSYTAPLPPSLAPPQPTQKPLSRHNTVIKPDSRQWAAMGEEERHDWLRKSQRTAKETKTPLVDLSR